jgi:bacillithiol system protein YtxJ
MLTHLVPAGRAQGAPPRDEPAPAGWIAIFKSSRACWSSVIAEHELEWFAMDHPAVTLVRIDVRSQPELSAEVTWRYAVPHATPQVILLQAGTVRWVGSGSAVTTEGLEAAVRRVPPIYPDPGPVWWTPQ